MSASLLPGISWNYPDYQAAIKKALNKAADDDSEYVRGAVVGALGSLP